MKPIATCVFPEDEGGGPNPDPLRIRPCVCCFIMEASAANSVKPDQVDLLNRILICSATNVDFEFEFVSII